jgi:hypothetical protein
MAHFAPLIGDGESRLLSCWLMRQSALAERLLWVKTSPSGIGRFLASDPSALTPGRQTIQLMF